MKTFSIIREDCPFLNYSCLNEEEYCSVNLYYCTHIDEGWPPKTCPLIEGVIIKVKGDKNGTI
jgi:hypothetical protein